MGLEECEIAVEGDSATAGPVTYDAPTGKTSHRYKMKKEADCVWRIVYDEMIYSHADVGFWMSYLEEVPVNESDKYKRFYHGLKEKGITVFPGVAQSDDGATYHLTSRDLIASFFQSRGVSAVYLSDRERRCCDNQSLGIPFRGFSNRVD